MILCTNCGKENQDHYKFCLGCGAKLLGPSAAAKPAPQRPPIAAPSAPKTVEVLSAKAPEDLPPPPAVAIPLIVSRPTNQPHATSAAPATPLPISAPAHPPAAPPSAPKPPETSQPAPSGNVCAECGTGNPVGFRFCGFCGARLGAPASAPATPPLAAPSPPTPAAPSPPLAAPIPAVKHRANLTLIRIDGSEGGTLPIEGGPNTFGRLYGPPFDADFYLSPRHCELTVLPDGLLVDDRGGLNGVYRKLHGRTELQDGDLFRVGQELLLYEDLPEPRNHPDGAERMGSPNPGYWGRISLLIDGKVASEAYPIEGAEFSIGRERGDLTFPLDGYVSSSHCRIIGDDSGVHLEDRGSSNGTYVRTRSGTVVPYGSLLLVGQQLFRIDRA